MNKHKWTKYPDEMTGYIIHVLDDFSCTMDLQARIFQERVDLKYAKETRFFPQINDNIKEKVIIIGDDRTGYKTLTEAKKALVEEFTIYFKSLEQCDIHKYLLPV